jgi:hypothetical protein
MVKRRSGAGRPASGLRPGEKVRDYPRLQVRVPRRIVDLLEQTSKLEGRPQWRIVADAIVEYAKRVLTPKGGA